MLVDKTLSFVGRSGRSDVIRVGIDMPIPSSVGGLEGFMECPIHLGYENAGRSSVFDVDTSSAIDRGLDSVQSFLNALSIQGTLRWEDGADYEFGNIQKIRDEVWEKAGLRDSATKGPKKRIKGPRARSKPKGAE